MVSPLPPGSDADGHAGDVKWFAGLAMQAIIAKHGIPETQSARDEIALWSFRMAQAMVATDRNLHASQGP